MFLGYVPAPLIAVQAKVDVRHPQSAQGYQRVPVQGRIGKVATYYERGGLMSNPLMLNIRDSDMHALRVDAVGPGKHSFKAAVRDKSNWVGSGMLTFPRDLSLWMYDGQHRQAGLALLLQRHSEIFANFPVPVAITLGLSRTAEAREFYELNTNAVAVQTDLAWTLLASLAAEDPSLRDTLVDRERDWLIKGEEIVSELERKDGPWHGRFLPVNTRKRMSDGTLVRRAQFVRSLRPVLEFPLLKRANATDIAEIVNAHWLGIAQVLPDAFVEPAGFVLQKGTGINTFHTLLPHVIEIIRSRCQRLTDPQAHAEVLRGLKDLSGYAVVGGSQIQTSGAEFWRVGSAASTFSGNAGKRRIRALVQEVLPTPEEAAIILKISGRASRAQHPAPTAVKRALRSDAVRAFPR